MINVDKGTVKKALKLNQNQGIIVGLLPCKVMKDNMYISMYTTTIFSIEELDKVINEYTYYNCNYEVGYYPKYFISQHVFNNISS